jgi:hypothetical protein
MMTRGVTLSEFGTLVLQPRRAVPDAFWSRLKHHIAKAKLFDAFEAEFTARRAEVLENASCPAISADTPAEAEEKLFLRWVAKVCGPQRLNLWDRGWTEAYVDTYPECTTQGAPP